MTLSPRASSSPRPDRLRATHDLGFPLGALRRGGRPEARRIRGIRVHPTVLRARHRFVEDGRRSVRVRSVGRRAPGCRCVPLLDDDFDAPVYAALEPLRGTLTATGTCACSSPTARYVFDAAVGPSRSRPSGWIRGAGDPDRGRTRFDPKLSISPLRRRTVGAHCRSCCWGGRGTCT